MWQWLVMWRVSALVVVTATLNFDFITTNRQLEAMPTTQMDCFVYSKFGTHRFGRAFNEDWRSRNPITKNRLIGYNALRHPLKHVNTNNFISRRLETLFPKETDLVKEHAKLVQDINSLKQVVFVAPFAEDSRDYDESVFHEIIETTTTIRPSTTRPGRPIKSSSIPIILLGGEHSHQVLRSQPMSFPKSTINLVGTTFSPLKHPYPFVTKGVSERPLKVCMPSIPPFPATTRRPTLWERLVNAILPRPG